MQPPTVSTSPPKSRVPLWTAIILGCGCLGVAAILVVVPFLWGPSASLRDKARAAMCLSNVKVLGTGVTMYLQDYDEHYPLSQNWAEGLQSYVTKTGSSDSYYTCPTFPPSGERRYGYAYNQNLSHKATKNITFPRSTVMFYETGDLQRNASAPVPSFEDEHTIEVTRLPNLPNPARHGVKRGSYSVGFADGHARLLHQLDKEE